ncbi:hypothetical protein MUK42_26880 [Musa troglodytarum]|uniref:Uncharacterized protein n=1 Tax=Musa troglodytarum TaxID=320322 RepID=A0A9E7EQC0_9LILI|nr:hypothetical protein MUK42_26880 [Musa troglodytarum]
MSSFFPSRPANDSLSISSLKARMETSQLVFIDSFSYRCSTSVKPCRATLDHGHRSSGVAPADGGSSIDMDP